MVHISAAKNISFEPAAVKFHKYDLLRLAHAGLSVHQRQRGAVAHQNGAEVPIGIRAGPSVSRQEVGVGI